MKKIFSTRIQTLLQATIIYVKYPITLEDFLKRIRDAYKLTTFDKITIKWMDDEGEAVTTLCFIHALLPGDPCTISKQTELDEAFRLYHLQNDENLVVHVFMGEPSAPGMSCPGEDRELRCFEEERQQNTQVRSIVAVHDAGRSTTTNEDIV